MDVCKYVLLLEVASRVVFWQGCTCSFASFFYVYG